MNKALILLFTVFLISCAAPVQRNECHQVCPQKMDLSDVKEDSKTDAMKRNHTLRSMFCKTI